MQNDLVLIRGGGDLASGVALRLHHAGLRVVITELAQPLAVRRAVSFSDAVYAGRHTVEDVTARLVSPDQLRVALDAGEIPILIDPDLNILQIFDIRLLTALVDARLLKQPPHPLPMKIPLHIGLGPGFCAGENCHAVIETRRSHTLGRVYWSGTPQPDSGQPEGDPRRVLRASSAGNIISHANIGDHVEEGQLIAEIQSPIINRKSKIVSPFSGSLRGLIHDGLTVTKGMKIGDIDPRDDASLCALVSDKALAVGGGVLEAILAAKH
jgi:xanthine dehydrogenase accessory factor